MNARIDCTASFQDLQGWWDAAERNIDGVEPTAAGPLPGDALLRGPGPHRMNLTRAVQSGLVLGTLQRSASGSVGRALEVVELGQWYLTSISGNGSRFLRRGWHAAEEWGAWGDGDHNELRVALPPHDGDLVLEVEAAAGIIGSRQAQRIFVNVSGRPAGYWTFSQARNRGVRTVRVPTDAIRRQDGGLIVDVEFYPQLAMAPRELGERLSDGRVLGLGLSRFRVVTAASPSDSIILESARFPASDVADAREHQLQTAEAHVPPAAPQPGLPLPPAPRRSIPRRVLGKGMRTLRALRIPYFDDVEKLARRAMDASRARLQRGSVAQFPDIGMLERKIDDLERRLAAGALQNQHAASMFEDRLAEVAAMQLLAQRRLERLLSELERRSDAVSAAVVAATEQQRKSAAAQTAAVVAATEQQWKSATAQTAAMVAATEQQWKSATAQTAAMATATEQQWQSVLAQTAGAVAETERRLAASLAALENSRLPSDEEARRVAGELRGALDQLRELTIHGANVSAEVKDLAIRTRTDVASLIWRNVVPVASDSIVMRNRYGYLCVPLEDRKLVAHLADGTLPEPGTQLVLEALLKPGSTFLDVGAHIGMFTLLGARLVGDTGKVIALEPTPRLVECLRQATVMNNIEQVVEIHEVAAADAEAPMTLNIALPYGHNSLFALPGAHAAVTVNCVTIDALLGPARKIDVVKIDVEGAELAVMRGMTRTLEHNPHAVVIVEFGPSHLARAGIAIEDWMKELRGLGFDIWEIDDAALRLRGLREAGLGDVTSLNLLLTRGTPEQLRHLMPEREP
jgi:FkbM family methyltransferase